MRLLRRRVAPKAFAALVCCSLYGFRSLTVFLRTGVSLSTTMSEDDSTSDSEWLSPLTAVTADSAVCLKVQGDCVERFLCDDRLFLSQVTEGGEDEESL